jgi:dienelactone hydrolase
MERPVRRNFTPWAYWQLRLAGQSKRPVPGDVEAWRRDARDRLDALLGPMPEAVPLDLEVTETVSCDGYDRSRVVFDTEAGMSVPAYLLVPHGRTDPGTAVLAVHGHGEGKSVVCGTVPSDNGDYAQQLASRGHVVLAPDLRCFGERQDPQWSPGDHKYDCDWNLVCAVMSGVNPVAQNLWDLQRSLDVLCDHALVDHARVGVAGLSYGGTMSLLLAATDARVRAAVVSGYVSSWAAAHRVPWNMCGSQVMFGQLGAIEHCDLLALAAPTPLLVESGTEDVIFPVDAARETVAVARRAYAHVDAVDALEHDVFEGDHRWNGARAYDFLAIHL